jgi:hypothetical protein
MRALPLTLALALAPALAGAQTPPAPQVRLGPVPLRFYGIIWASASVSNGVESFGNANGTAVTGAVNPVTFAQPDESFLCFQVQQSRIGVQVGEATPVRGQLEFDFIHFDQSSPTTQAFPRVRIAAVNWSPSPSQRLFVGQDWDVFSPLNAHTVNLVGNNFTAGNAGFMRHQLGWAGNFGHLELVAAVGLPGANAGPTFANIELGAVPTGSVRVAWKSPRVWAGGTFLATAARFGSPNSHERRLALGANLFGELTLGAWNLRGEVYYGENLASLGALTLGVGRVGRSVTEAGGWISLRYTTGPHQVYGGVGAAAALEPDAVALGYTPPTTSAAAVRTPGAGFGVISNLAGRVGYQVSPWRGLSIAVEPFVYRTVHKLHDGASVDGTRLAAGASLGVMYTF